jgi:quercetin dioxygenase-like cupin family protein
MTERTLEIADLAQIAAHEVGAAWSFAGEQLNATLVSWEPGHEVADHVNDEREVLLLVLRGDGVLQVDGDEHELVPGRVVVLPRGAGRSIHAGPGGLAYVTAHQARGPLQVTRRRAPRVPPA